MNSHLTQSKLYSIFSLHILTSTLYFRFRIQCTSVQVFAVFPGTINRIYCHWSTTSPVLVFHNWEQPVWSYKRIRILSTVTLISFPLSNVEFITTAWNFISSSSPSIAINIDHASRESTTSFADIGCENLLSNRAAVSNRELSTASTINAQAPVPRRSVFWRLNVTSRPVGTQTRHCHVRVDVGQIQLLAWQDTAVAER